MEPIARGERRVMAFEVSAKDPPRVCESTQAQ